MNSIKISGSILQAYLICPRQAWLMSRNISGNQYNDFIAIGRLISEESYKRDKKEIRIGNNVIDVVKKDNNEIILIETKKSSRAIEASEMQLLYYIYNLKKNNKRIRAEIRIPKEKKIVPVKMTKEKEKDLLQTTSQIDALLQQESPPKLEKNKYCKKCSYLEFCWA